MNRVVHTAMAASLALASTVACDSERVAEPNLAPTAEAGGGGTYYDRDGSGVAVVHLDGSGSLDPDGMSTGYAWTEEGASIATGRTADVTLPLGQHYIVLTVTDDEGESDSDAVIVTVEFLPMPNTPPVVTILSPTPGDVFDDDQTITFSGMAVDGEEGALHGERLSWWLYGAVVRGLGTGESVRAADLVEGHYWVSLVATDINRAQGEARVEFTVRFHASFAADVLPFFVAYCSECHGADREEGGIRLDSYEAIATGGNASGPPTVPGDPSRGILIPQVLSDHEPVGWGGNEFSQNIATKVLPAWIADGAPDN